MLRQKYVKTQRKGIALVIAMIFIAVFMAMAAGMVSMSSANTQVASSHHQANTALNAALSGLEWARYQVRQLPVLNTGQNTVSDAEANGQWTALQTRLTGATLGGQALISQRFEDAVGEGDELWTGQASGLAFQLRFFRYDSNPRLICVQSIGSDGTMLRKVQTNLSIEKEKGVLNYGIASRGRIWLAGDTTVHGSVYSAWNLSNSQLTQLTSLKDQIKLKIAAGTLNSTTFAALVSSLALTTTHRTTILNELTNGTLSPEKAATRCIGLMSTTSLSVAPFNTTGDSTVLGSINTCWTKGQVDPKSWQFETWDTDGNPIYQTDGNGDIVYETDGSGEYLLDDNGDKIKARVINSGDELQGICAGVNYGEAPHNLAGMNIADYNTTEYYNATRTANGGSGDIASPSSTQYTGTDAQLASLGATCGTKWRYERFPHDSGNYTAGSGIQVKRYIYKNQTFSNVRLPVDKNALFINCTFDDVLYVDAGKTTSNYNNVRFDNCNFNGTIVSNTPQAFNWQKNTLYFTGSATFQNDTSADATILAPHFNVNLGNTNPVAGTENVLRGAIVGGIVDVRGNAEIYGTIISMADTSSYTSGYVSNIGATLLDGGSETVEIGDVGTIEITPDPDKKLPSGITTPIIIKPLMNSYTEVQCSN